MNRQDRVFAPAIVPLMAVKNAVAEVERVAELEFQALYSLCGTSDDRAWRLDLWEPLWATAEELPLPLPSTSDPVGKTSSIAVKEAPS